MQSKTVRKRYYSNIEGEILKMSLLTQPGDIKSTITFKGLIYGQPGIGKSTLALSAPNPVCIDTDKGMHRVEPQLRAPSLQVNSYEQILELLNSKELAQFETIVFDTIGEVLTVMEPYLIKQNPKNAKANGSLSLQGYGARKYEFIELLKLIAKKNKSVLFVAHEKEEKSGDDKVIRPDIGGSSSSDIIKLLDFVGYMEAKGNRRTISFAPTDKYYAKNSLKLDEYITIPDTKDGNSFIADKIVRMTKERLDNQAELLKQYEGVMQGVQDIVDDMEDPNESIKDLQILPVIWDSKIRAWSVFNAAAKEQGWEYDKKTKTFISTKPVEKQEKPAAEEVVEPTPATQQVEAKVQEVTQ